jgi:hypothetical protein
VPDFVPTYRHGNGECAERFPASILVASFTVG